VQQEELLARSRLVAAVLAASAMFSPGVAAAQDASTRYVVSGTGGSGIAVRSAPAFDAPTLGALPEGTIIGADAVAGTLDWVAVQPPRDSSVPSGYASAAFVSQMVEGSVPGARVLQARVTGYANGSDGGAVGFITASGTHTQWGTVAADWRLFPLGTRLQIEGFDGVTFTVEDTGSGVRGLLFDVWFPDVPTAQAFGTQRRKVTVLP
jgi:3D (Asp-Asp-Asp) domain-containing protein